MTEQADLTEQAPAKVNLSLHVGPPKPNGRHDLNSLVSFADAGAADTLSACPAPMFSLAVDGPFAGQAGPDTDNLVLKAARALNERMQDQLPKLAFRLTKNLPCAAGIGGGSADAAAALRLIVKDANGRDDVSRAAMAVAPQLGGDVLACYHSMPGMMAGEGERYEPVPALPALPALLVNPGAHCPTGPVFGAFDRTGAALSTHSRPPSAPMNADDFIAYLKAETTNSLEAPAISLVPIIDTVLNRLRSLDAVRLVRMSGSGATCFALFETIEAAAAAAESVQETEPDWWTAAIMLGAT